MALADEDGGQAVLPGVFHSSKNVQLVIDHDVAGTWIPLLNVLQHLFLVNIDEDMTLDGVPET